MQQHVLIAFREGEPDRHCVVGSDPCIIGRATHADLALADSTISREHARVRVEEGTLVVEDYRSTNGVFVNGQRVVKCPVQQGDFLSLGPYTIVVRTFGEKDEQAVPCGKTVHIAPDTANQLHQDFLEKHGSDDFPLLLKATQLLGERLSLDELLSKILALVMATLPARRGFILIGTNDAEEPRIGAFRCAEDNTEAPPLSRTLTGYVMRTKTALLTANARIDPRFSNADSVVHLGIETAMCVPLGGRDRVVGVIYVDTRRRANSFVRRHLELLTVLGRVLGVAVENKLLEETRVKQERLAVLGEALAGVSHDMKNIFGGIKGGIELLDGAREQGDPDQMSNACRIMRRSVDRFEGFLMDLLAYAKGKEPDYAPACVDDLIGDVFRILQPKAAQCQVQLVRDGSFAKLIHIDSRQIHRVLLNLIQNAVDACEGKGGTVTVSSMADPRGVTIRVSDTGAGIPPEVAAHLSEPFFTTKGSRGTGLGLASSYRIVEQHGGHISVETRPEGGSTFTVSIPDHLREPGIPAEMHVAK